MKFLLGAPTDAAAATKQFPAHVFEGGRSGMSTEPAALGAPHLVHRLVEVSANVEAIQDMKSLAGLGRDHIEMACKGSGELVKLARL
jgi:hypothetical protein